MVKVAIPSGKGNLGSAVKFFYLHIFKLTTKARRTRNSTLCYAEEKSLKYNDVDFAPLYWASLLTTGYFVIPKH